MAGNGGSTVHDEFDLIFRTALTVNITLVVLIPALIFVTLVTCGG